MTVGELLVKRRKELDLTLEDVGRSVGVTKATVLRWENGAIHTMKRDKIAALAAVLQLDPSVLIPPTEVLTEEEKKLLSAYRSLSPEGKQYLLLQTNIASALNPDITQTALPSK